MRNVMPKFQNFRWNGIKYTIQINRYILKKNEKGAISGPPKTEPGPRKTEPGP